MPTRVRLFVSAGPAEEPAREILGQALAELPVRVGWIIKRTPDVDAVPECHLFALVLGADITAPVGLELWWARRTDKPILAYASADVRTPAGEAFHRENALLSWSRCADLPALRREFHDDIAAFLLAHPDRYGLSIGEAAVLRAFRTTLSRSGAAPAGQGSGGGEVRKATGRRSRAAGAGGGGVILAPGKDEPPGARLIDNEET